MVLKQSYYTSKMYMKDIAQWEAVHEGEVYEDKNAQAVHDRTQLKISRRLRSKV